MSSLPACLRSDFVSTPYGRALRRTKDRERETKKENCILKLFR